MVKICNEPYPVNSKYEEYFELYPYPLSDFQKYAIEAIVEGQHVLVTAHTGSGKTLPAEFAITHFVGKGQKVIYTTPIKALSNQKYYEFTRKYPHISFGLMTGDIKTNPDADVVIMTTELMLNLMPQIEKDQPTQQDQEKTQEKIKMEGSIKGTVGSLILDEVHYINDQERGQVWEKVILLLPPHIQMVMLSATIDQPERFAKWCERDYDKQVYLCSTNHRVVPLSHYGFLTTTEAVFKGLKDKALEKEIRDNTNKLILLQSDKGIFQEMGYKNIAKMRKTFETKQVFMKRKHVLNNLALYLRDHEMLPAIAFVFSRKNVELCAHEITVPLLEDDSKVPYIVSRECEQIIRKLPNYQEYLNLPEYRDLVGLLEKGIGIHHSGMIPILREIVELMISKKYIKLLFATESFAIGLDCPIKTAVFTSVTKFDGNYQRLLMAHEYTQMAGRAGRRGIDTIGYVVHCNNIFDLPCLNDYKSLLGGTPQSLVSKFRISYPLVLSIMAKLQNMPKELCLKNDQELCLKNDKTPFVEFVNKSMVYNELNSNIQNQKQRIQEMLNIYLKKQEFIKFLKIGKEKCLKYLDLETKLKMTPHKKRKDLEKEMESIRDESKTWQSDIQSVKEFIDLEENIENEKSHLHYLENYIVVHIEKVCDVLSSKGFIENTDTLTTNGTIATKIAEVHPLITAKWVTDTNGFQKYTVKQLIGFLTTMVDIKVPDDLRSTIPNTPDKFLKSQIELLNSDYVEYQEMETRMDMYTGIQYEGVLKFDIIDLAMDWCECGTEEECRIFMNDRLAEKSISTGDFAKGMVKIVAICRELSIVAEEMGNMEFLKKLSEVDAMVLKYIATTQSLYV